MGLPYMKPEEVDDKLSEMSLDSRLLGGDTTDTDFVPGPSAGGAEGQDFIISEASPGYNLAASSRKVSAESHATSRLGESPQWLPEWAHAKKKSSDSSALDNRHFWARAIKLNRKRDRTITE